MGRTPWATYLWPGVPQLWKQGDWYALGLAVGFAALVNLAIATTLLWCELLAPGMRTGTWVAVVVVWVGSAAVSRFWDRQAAEETAVRAVSDAYPEAVEHYLRGNWFEAERILGDVLRRNAKDVDARLMLATLLRHTGRWNEAVQQLDGLERFEGSQKWALEIARERQWLQAAQEEAAGALAGSGEGTT